MIQAARQALGSPAVALVEQHDVEAARVRLVGQAATDAPPVIRVDTTSNTLLVRATDAQYETIVEVATAVDTTIGLTGVETSCMPILPTARPRAGRVSTLYCGGSAGRPEFGRSDPWRPSRSSASVASTRKACTEEAARVGSASRK